MLVILFLKPATTDFCPEISFNGLEIRKISSAQKIWKPWKICTIFWLVNFNACWPIPTKNAQMLLFFTDLNWPEVDQRIWRETTCSTLRSCLSKSIIEFFNVALGMQLCHLFHEFWWMMFWSTKVKSTHEYVVISWILFCWRLNFLIQNFEAEFYLLIGLFS